MLTPEHAHWPSGLNDLGPTASVALWARGNTALLTSSAGIAIVGAWAATSYGELVAVEITAGSVDCGRSGYSGAAYGIDGAAHCAALASRGTTIAIFIDGVDRFYLTGHDALLTRIAESGVMLSKVSSGHEPTKWRFLAAASTATVDIEAGLRSGSLATAVHAVSLKRPLGAVPRHVASSASAGCCRPIRNYGATWVANADDAHLL